MGKPATAEVGRWPAAAGRNYDENDDDTDEDAINDLGDVGNPMQTMVLMMLMMRECAWRN